MNLLILNLEAQDAKQAEGSIGKNLLAHICRFEFDECCLHSEFGDS